MATNTPLQSILLTSSTSTITFSNINQNYTDLVLVISAKVDTGFDIWVRCNGDSASNYGYTVLAGNGTTPSSYRATNQTEGLLADWEGTPTTTFGHILTFTLNNYSNTTTYKTSLARSNRATNGVDIVTSTWRSTAAVTSLTLRASNASRTFDAGTTVDLYGIKAGSSSAVGGDLTVTDGNYWYHVFNSSGTFTPTTALSVDYLVVAGGAGGAGSDGGTSGGGGGGAGGLRSTVTATGGGGSLESKLSLASGTVYTVTVGSGGAAGGAGQNNGSNGSNSAFSSITSTGGGGGSWGQRTAVATANTGGSGGGAGSTNLSGANRSNGGAGTANQGYEGGYSAQAPNAAAGGGGAGQSGREADITGAGRAGGIGVQTSISGTATYYAGGGGGGNSNTNSINTGGTGGGGAGARTSVAATAGTSNTGGGGGGGQGGGAGAAGGSGIVIVRYAV